MPHPTTPNIYLFNLQFYIKSKINPNPLSPTPCSLTSDETELSAFFVSPLLILPFLFLFYASFSYRGKKGGKGRVMATKKMHGVPFHPYLSPLWKLLFQLKMCQASEMKRITCINSIQKYFQNLWENRFLIKVWFWLNVCLYDCRYVYLMYMM